MIVGKVLEIWRYPVKSMGGERLGDCKVRAGGVSFDRVWALRDEAAGEVRGAKYMPELMLCSARYRDEPTDNDSLHHVDITLPDGTETASDDVNVNRRLSELLGRAVSLWPLRPAADKAHYRRRQAGASIVSRMSRSRRIRPYLGSLIHYAGLDGPTREMFSREAGEPLPDFSNIPSELFEFTSPPGTYFDAFPIHVVTTSSLKAMAELNPTSVWDARRFRPNFLIETKEGIRGLVEAGWTNKEIVLGEVSLKCEIPTVRCGMTTHAQPNLQKDPSVLRTIVREADQNLGVYASVIRPGRVHTGDTVELM